MKNIQLLFCSFLLISTIAQAQDDASKTAKVQVLVTDTRQRPLKGEEVIFQTVDAKKSLSRKTDASGKILLSLAPGASYLVRLRSFEDTTNYSTLDIPALKAGESFDGAFSIDIEFEPAKTFTLHNIFFDSGKPSLRAESYAQLNELAEYVKTRGDKHFEIAGHTDNVGQKQDNLKLSQARAEAVKAYLVKKGASPAKISAKGYGANQPVASNDTAEGRQLNRRTELIITE